jgi:hypothetical protein
MSAVDCYNVLSPNLLRQNWHHTAERRMLLAKCVVYVRAGSHEIPIMTFNKRRCMKTHVVSKKNALTILDKILHSYEEGDEDKWSIP